MFLTRRSFSALTLGACLAPGAARAQSNGQTSSGQVLPTVVELFTSQGCSSCPAADALMVEMAKQPGMIPLTYPVEIWDYLGWKDTLAKSAFTKRQRAYAAMVAGKRVYTPQAIVNGRAHCVGSDFSAISRLKTSTGNPAGTRLVLSSTAEGWSATLALPAGASSARLVLLPVASSHTVQIGRGENSGRAVTYANVVREIRDLGTVEPGGKTFHITRQDVAADLADGFALLLQTGSIEAPGAVLAGALVNAAGIRA